MEKKLGQAGLNSNFITLQKSVGIRSEFKEKESSAHLKEDFQAMRGEFNQKLGEIHAQMLQIQFQLQENLPSNSQLNAQLNLELDQHKAALAAIYASRAWRLALVVRRSNLFVKKMFLHLPLIFIKSVGHFALNFRLQVIKKTKVTLRFIFNRLVRWIFSMISNYPTAKILVKYIMKTFPRLTDWIMKKIYTRTANDPTIDCLSSLSANAQTIYMQLKIRLDNKSECR